jgi:hypothetical protein
MGGDHQHWNVADLRIRQLRSAELLATHDWHHQVQQDEARAMLPGQIERLDAVGRSHHLHALDGEHRLHHDAQFRVVLDQQHQTATHQRVESTGPARQSLHDSV